MPGLRRFYPIVLYVPSTAGAAVYVKMEFERASPVTITFSTFVICWIFFLAINFRRIPFLTRLAVANLSMVLLLDVYTLLSWVGIFACIQLLSGSVELVVFMSCIPLVSVIVGREWSRITPSTKFSVVAITACSMIVVLVHPQMQRYGLHRQLVGLIVGLGAGGLAACYIVASGSFQRRHSLSSIDLICLRLPLLLILTLIPSVPDLWSGLSWIFIEKTVILSIAAVIIPTYALQQTIALLGGVLTAVLMPLVPVVGLFFEWTLGLTGCKFSLKPGFYSKQDQYVRLGGFPLNMRSFH